MNCMKCGRDIQSGQVFCALCLEEMKKYPVNPGAAIRLPRRPDPQLKRAARRKNVSEEEQIRILKKRLKITTWLLAVTVALLIAMTIPTAVHLAKEHIAFLPGQNYSSVSGSTTAGN